MSGLPGLIGLCVEDTPRIAQAVNRAERRLILAREAGDEGWYGTWAEIRFNVIQAAPVIVLPREVARLEAVSICRRPVPLRNPFYDYQQFGSGRLFRSFIQAISTQTGALTQIFGSCFGLMQVRTKNSVPTFNPISTPPQLITVFLTNPLDAQKRVLLQGLDPANNVIYSLDGAANVQGQYVTLLAPSVQAAIPMNLITGIQKDQTLGQVQIFQTDPATGVQVLIHTMEPSETTSGYREYRFDGLPVNCCGDPNSNICKPVNGQNVVQVTAIAKLEHLDVQTDTDYLLLHNLEAIMEEAQAVRYDPMDTAEAKGMAATHHKNAIGNLNGELTHYYGKDEPAVQFAPFGSARLSHQRIGTMI